MHLAELNIAQPKYTNDDPRFAEFMDYLDKHGNSDFAFGWSHLPHVKLWETQRCG